MTTQAQGHSGAIYENPAGGPLHKVPLGTLVLRAELMPRDRIEGALREAVGTGRRLGEVLLEWGLPERDLMRLLAAQHAQPFVDLTAYPIDGEAVSLLPPSVAKTYCALPIGKRDDCVIVAAPDTDAARRERLSEALHAAIRLVTAPREDIKAAIEDAHARLAAPAAAPTLRAPVGSFDVEATLTSGARVLVGRTSSQEAAEALADRVVEAAEAGLPVETREASVSGEDVVSVEILRRL